MANTKPKVDPLVWNVPIVSAAGLPSPEFQRKWAQQRSINDAVPWNAASMSALLDYIANTKGDLLVRGATQWTGLLAPADATKFLNGAIPSVFAAVKDTDLALTDVTGNNVTAARHGFAPKLPNDAAKYLDGTGAYTAPPDNVILGAGVPTSVEDAGTLYSRTDATELYVSHPTPGAGRTPLPVQFASTSGHSVPGVVTLPGAPTAGNLLIAILGTDADSHTLLSASWNIITFGGATHFGLAAYRYVQLGDVAALPTLTTSGTRFWFAEAYEITDVTGVWATDFDAFVSAYDLTTSTVATTAHLTAADNTLGVIGSGRYNSNTNITVSAGWTQDIQDKNFTNYGAWTGVSHSFPTTGTSASATFTYGSGDQEFYIALFFKGDPPGPTVAHWDFLAPETTFGTVTSVALALPSSILTVGGSPVTTSGTLTGTLATQTANRVWAGPTTGAAAQPTFRALVNADMPSSGAGSGTVTSVAATVPSILSIAGSPITSSGTLAITLANQSANLVWAGPTTGAAAAPTFRALVAADIPALSYVTSVAATVPTEFAIAGSPITSSGTLAITKATQTANFVWAGPTSGGAAQPAFRALVNADMPGSGAGSGTVTSVAMTVPSILSVAGSPVTSSGTLAITLATQAAHTVLAGPTSGSAATPTFRTLADTEITGTTAGAIPFVASGAFVEDTSKIFFDGTNGFLGLGLVTPVAPLHIQTSQVDLQWGNGVNSNMTRCTNNAGQFSLNFRKGRGTPTVPLVVVLNDTLGSFNFQGFGGVTNYRPAFSFRCNVIEPTPSDTKMGGQLTFIATPLGSVTGSEMMRFEFATGLSMYGANPVVDANRVIRLRVYTVATLPAGVDGGTAYVSDALAPVFGALVAAGGIRRIPVFYDGNLAQWTVG